MLKVENKELSYHCNALWKHSSPRPYGSPMLWSSISEWRSGSGGAGATEYCSCGQEEEGEKPGARSPGQ